MDFYGNDFKFTDDVKSWEDCGKLCLSEPDCKAWTWRKPQENRCYMKKYLSNPKPNQAAAISGARGCGGKGVTKII